MARFHSSAILTTIAASFILTGCATTQLTTGADYNARNPFLSGQKNYASSAGTNIDAEVAEIAAIEPSLAFPARIGIAFIRNGQLVALPADHIDAWQPLLDRLQPDYGEVVPISPMIAAMVNPADRPSGHMETINDIRRGAARQHVDYTLIYEINRFDRRKKRNALSVTDLSIIGLFILPSRSVEVEASASAVFMDVRNGYPYGTASGVATKDGISTAVDAGDKRRSLSDRAEIAAVADLAEDVTIMFDDLIAQLDEKTQS